MERSVGADAHAHHDIPDEVAQHAEGHRITAYVALGRGEGQGAERDQAQLAVDDRCSSVRQYEFDSFACFVYSIRHRRYETAYIERNVRGYYPVETQDIPGQEAKAFRWCWKARMASLQERVCVQRLSRAHDFEDAVSAASRVAASACVHEFRCHAAAPVVDGGWWRNMRRRVFGN
jgi:hypothetical protein